MNKTGNYRWRIVALLFFATTINYIDRQVIGILKPFRKVSYLPGYFQYLLWNLLSYV